MKLKVITPLIFLFLLLTFAACQSRGNLDTLSAPINHSKTTIIPKSDLGTENLTGNGLAIIVSFKDDRTKPVHAIDICLLIEGSTNYTLTRWFETYTHPSSPEFHKEINLRWKKDFLKRKSSLLEASYYPEPIGEYKLEAIYIPSNSN